MHAFYVISSALFAASYAKILVPSYTSSSADPTITKAPQANFELLRKQNDNRFIGWLSLSDSSWESEQCSTGLTFFQTTSDMWGCCTDCQQSYLAIGCAAGILIFSLTSTGTKQLVTYACDSIYTDPIYQSYTVCNTAYIYENMQDADPLTNIFCGTKVEDWNYYRQKPVELTSTTTPTSTPPYLSLSTTIISTVGPTITPTDPAVLPPVVSNPTPKKKKSQVWIAGAVVGPLVGLALVGGLIFFLVRRKKDKTVVQPLSTAAPSYPRSPNHQLPPQPYNNHLPLMQQNQHSMASYSVAGAVKHPQVSEPRPFSSELDGTYPPPSK